MDQGGHEWIPTVVIVLYFVSGVSMVIASWRLDKYLQANHPQRLAEYSGLTWAIKFSEYTWSNLDTDEPHVARLKKGARVTEVTTLSLFFLMPVTSIVFG